MGIQLVLWSLRRRPWRHALIGICVALTVGVMMGFFSALTEIQRFLARADQIPYERLYVKPRYFTGARMVFPLSMKDEIARIPQVQEVLWAVFVRAQTPDQKPVLIVGGVDTELERNADFFPVEADAIERWKGERQGAVIADGVAEMLGLKVGDLSELSTPTGKFEFKVSGISRGGSLRTRIVVHHEYLDAFLGSPGGVHDYRVLIPRGADRAQVVVAVDELFRTHGFAAHTLTDETMNRYWGVEHATMLPSLLGLLGLLLMVTTGMAIANVTAISVRERRAELATMRVIGFHRSTIGRLIMSEALLICVAGGAVGAAVAWYVFRSGITLGLGGVFMQSMKLNPEGIVAGLALTLLIPIFGSGFSSWLAVRAPLAEALREVG